jgi:predicted kinase
VASPRAVIVVSGPAGVGKSTVSRAVASAFDRSVHLRTDDFMASVVSGWVDPSVPEAEPQNRAIGGAVAASAIQFAVGGYTTIIDGDFFPDGVAWVAGTCAARGVSCHYVVLSADLETCWARASARPEGRWPLEAAPVAALHARYAALDLAPRHVIDASGTPDATTAGVLAAFDAGTLAVSTATGDNDG